METAMLILVSLIFAAGVAGCFLPVVPGNLVVLGGILLHKFVLVDASVSWMFIGFATLVTGVVMVLDPLCSWWGARRFGASWQGALGALVGAAAGMAFFGFPGLIAGPILGAVGVELVMKRNLRSARRAGVGTIVGGVVAFALKVGAAMAVAGGFFWALPG